MATTAVSAPRAPLTAAQRKLVTDNLALARHLARPWRRRHPELGDDFESAAGVGLIRAARTFDPSRGVKFSAFARHHVLGSIRDLRRRTRSRAMRALACPDFRLVRQTDPTCSGRALFVAEDRPVGAALEAADLVDRLLRALPRKHEAACRALYLEGRDTAQAARHLGCSTTRVSDLHQQALTMLRWSAGVPEARAA